MNTSALNTDSRKEQVTKILSNLICDLEVTDTEAYLQMCRLIEAIPAVRIQPNHHMDLFRWAQAPNHSLMVRCLFAIPLSFDHPGVDVFCNLVVQAKKIAAKG